MPTEDELISIVRRLDMDADAKISYAEFSEALKSQEFSRRISSPPRKNMYQEEEEK